MTDQQSPECKSIPLDPDPEFYSLHVQNYL